MDEEKDIEELRRVVDIVERILEFNDLNQRGQGLKRLTPDQMLSRLIITLAHLKSGNNSEKLKTKSGNYCTLCADQKN